MKSLSLICLTFMLFIFGCSKEPKVERESIPLPPFESYTVLTGGTEIGYLQVRRSGDSLMTDFDYKNNGRGPSIKDTILLDENGYPKQWVIAGATTFGNPIKEKFLVEGKLAKWTDATGSGEQKLSEPSLYVAQGSGPYELFLQASILMKSENMTAPALPAGQLTMTKIEDFKSEVDSSGLKLTSYAISGADTDPSYFILDENNLFFASMSPRFCIIRAGYEDEEKKMRSLAVKYATERYENLQAQFGHQYETPIRINNVRIFDPESLSLTDLSSVLVKGEKIISIDKPDTKSEEKETLIEGAGGTLIPGLYDMHAHMGQDDALLNILAGVTSVRDMGNNNEVLDSLIYKIEKGILAGPHITRLGFIEGKSDFSANNGIIVSSEEEAIAAVETYAEKGYYGVKLYNSMNGEWAPAIIKKAHDLGLFVCGHVPAFSNANNMIKAGYDEMTHINQVMLGWVLEADEDTRTLLRLTALKRLPALEMANNRIKETIDLMVENNVAIDPTLAIHEALMLSRNGEVRQGVLDYIDHMPPNVQRGYKVALASIEDETEDIAYREAYDKIIATLKVMKERGILIIPGTDMGGAFNLHRELELYQEIGYSKAELLKLGSYDMAKYLGHDNRGSIEAGKLADFFLVPGNPLEDIKAIKVVAMVASGGTIYYPTEVYPSFGIQPFVEKPAISE